LSQLVDGAHADDAEAEVHFHRGPQAGVAVCHDPTRGAMPRLDIA
jgi:hypothetical protein